MGSRLSSHMDRRLPAARAPFSRSENKTNPGHSRLNGVWIDGGAVRQSGPTHEVVSAYESAMFSRDRVQGLQRAAGIKAQFLRPPALCGQVEWYSQLAFRIQSAFPLHGAHFAAVRVSTRT
jgi:hypothetical protein